jgi:hypothetical protein
MIAKKMKLNFDRPLSRAQHSAAHFAPAGLFLAGFVLILAQGSTPALAQDSQPPKAEEPGFVESVGHWFGEQFDKLGSSFKDAGKKVSNIGHEAGVAAETTVEGAKDAANAVVRIPSTRMISGHEKCEAAPNGAPDCVAAATAICKKNGFGKGKSMDMTTAEVCPAQVYLSGRNSGPDCRTETFVSRALCQ